MLITKYILSQADLIGLLTILAEDKHKAQDGSNETTHVGQVGVNSIVTAFIGHHLLSLIDRYRCHVSIREGHEVLNGEFLWDAHYLLHLSLSVDRKQAPFCLDDILLQVGIGLDPPTYR